MGIRTGKGRLIPFEDIHPIKYGAIGQCVCMRIRLRIHLQPGISVAANGRTAIAPVDVRPVLAILGAVGTGEDEACCFLYTFLIRE